MKEFSEPIESDLSLAKAFDRVISKILLLLIDESKNLRPATFVDKVEIKVSEMAEADDLSKLVYLIAQKMESLTKKMESIYRSDKMYQNNHDILNSILNEVLSVLHLQLNGIASG